MINNTLLYTTILEDKGITQHCVRSRQFFSVCSECDTVFKIDVNCDKRDCPFCMKKRAVRLFRQYSGIVAGWEPGDGKVINFLTLTIKNVSDISKEWLDKQDSYLILFKRRLMSRGYVFDYGFQNKEMVWTPENGYHYHFHLLFFGPYLDLRDPLFNVSDIWRSITKTSYIVKLMNRFESGSHALNYLLKYVCKTDDLTSGVNTFYWLSRKRRLFQTFGKKYVRPKIEKMPFVCACCAAPFRKNMQRHNSPFFESIPADVLGVVHTYKRSSLIKALASRRAQRAVNFRQLSLNKEEVLLNSIAGVIMLDGNAEKVEELLGQNLKYLLERGVIFRPRWDTYRRID